MSWPSFLAPAWAWMSLLAIPLIALYLLRQKRPDVTVSSTLLWSKALADMRASTPFQKLRRNLLLLVQLLILAALCLALMRPIVQAHASQSRAGVIVIDATASMQTKDGGENGGGEMTRLDRAKLEAKNLVNSMRPGDRYMLVIDGGGLNHGGIGFTASKSELTSEIDRIKPSDTPSDLYESLLLAATSLRGINADNPNVAKSDALVAGKVWLFSDGAGIRVPDVMGNDLLQFVKIGQSDHSVGITQLSITPVPKQPRTYEVFVGLKNAWNVEKKIGLLLAYNSPDNFLPGQAQFVTLPPGGQGGVTFDHVVSDPGKLFVRADDTNDDFPLDNTAYGILEPPQKPRVLLVTPGNTLLENFIKTDVRVGAIDGQIVAPAAYSPAISADFVILDSFVPSPENMPKVDTLIIRPNVSGAGTVGGFKVTGEVENPAILGWKREDPVMQYVELADLRISKALLLDNDSEITALVSSPEAPLIAEKDFGSTRRYFVSFSPQVESNWWMEPSFLIFLQNMVEQTRTRHYIGVPELLAAGSPARLWDVGDDHGAGAVRITEPDGTVVETQAKDNAVEFPATDKLGFYQVDAPAHGGTGGAKKTLFAINLLSATESNIRPQSLATSSGGNVNESTSIATVNREVWQYLAAAALALLLIEWWLYHRRIT